MPGFEFMPPKLLDRFTRPFGLFLFALALTSLLAAFLLIRATPYGLGLANDSAAYIGGARGLLNGQGYSDVWLDSSLEPITHYPPLYSLTLAGLGLFGLDPLRGARLVNALAFGLSALLLGLLGQKMTRSYLAGLLLAVLFVTSGALLRIYAYALSEALFLTLSLLAFLSFAQYFEDQKKRWLLMAAAATGLAYLTRYTGLALAAGFCATLLLLKPAWRQRVRTVLLFLAAFVPFAATWAARNMLLAGNAANRTLSWHPVGLANIRRGIYAFSTFLMPVPEWQSALFKARIVHWFLAGIGLTLLIWLLVVGLRRFFWPKTYPQPEILAFSIGLYACAYLSSVVFSMSVFDASTKFQPRILSPLYLAFLVLLVALVHWLWRRGQRWMQSGLIVLVVLALGLSLVGFGRTFLELRKTGQGYASWRWRESPIMAALQNLPPDVAVYTNSPPAVYLVTGRTSRVMPTPFDAVTLEKRPEYAAHLAHMLQEIREGRAVLAIFDIFEVEIADETAGSPSFITDLPLMQKQGNNLLFGIFAEEK